MTATRETPRPGEPDLVRINPVSWSAPLGYDQAQLRRTPTHLLTIAGQGPTDESGQVQHAEDHGAQVDLAMRNVGTCLASAGMDWSDVMRLVLYTTDIASTLAAYQRVTTPLAGATPPATLVEVTRLALPGMAVEIEVTAGRW